ncbi:MAG: alpha-L-fucosidase [Candidatus Limimorpha sp.]
MKKVLIVLLILIGVTSQAQDLSAPEDNPVIVQRLEQWQDLKFGLMMHWGIYSQWGVVESWSICNEDWITRNDADYIEYKKDYQALNKTFNPVGFNADAWAEIAKDAGMKYVVFTTKHHDGFCLFNTKETSYSSVDGSCAFSSDERADITAEVVRAFRDNGFWTGLYFSKPDWHHDDYWARQWATPDRNVNYDPQRYPERWQRFCDFTFNQIKELTHNYGDIDILWLDGGWIRPEYSINDEYRSWLGCKGYVQDINIPRIAEMARENNPDLLIVDRTVHGKYENYRTPEQQVPDTVLPFPWETCMSMGDSWSYVENDNYKSTNNIIHILVDVVAKGGNYLLNVGPDAQGELPLAAVERLKEIGEWMKTNGDAIYETRPISPYSEGKFRFTQKNGRVFAVYLLDEDEELPSIIAVHDGFQALVSNKNISSRPLKLKILGNKAKAELRMTDDGYVIDIKGDINANHAIVFEFKK